MSLRLLIESLRGVIEGQSYQYVPRSTGWKTSTSTKLSPEITYQVTNYHPGDFGGSGKSQGELSISVTNGFPIKDALRDLGFTFDPKSKNWLLVHDRSIYPRQRFYRNNPAEKDVMRAIPKVEALVKEANAQIVQSNQARLSKAGIGGDMPKTTARDVMTWSDRQERSIRRLAKYGIVVTHEVDTGVAGFRKGGGVGQVQLAGNTFAIKDVLRKSGFKWNGKYWAISMRSFSDDTLAQLVRATDKDSSQDDSDSPQSVGSNRTKPGFDDSINDQADRDG